MTLDLLLEVGELAETIPVHLGANRRLDAYLSAAAVLSAVDDWLQWSSSLPSRVAEHLLDEHGRTASAAAGVVVAAAAGLKAGGTVARRTAPGTARLRSSRDDLIALTVELATLATADDVSSADSGSVAARAARVVDDARSWPTSASSAVARIPSCFRSFDQHPDDVAALVERFAGRMSDRSVPLVVAGVRTSGVHLGGLAVAGLRRAGFTNVDLLPLRPDDRLDPSAKRALATVGGRGVALVVDDPPASGGSIAGVARLLEAAGLRREQIVLMLATEADDGHLPPALKPWDSVLLPWPDWAVHRQLAVDSVAGALAGLAHVDGRPEFGDIEVMDDRCLAGAGAAPRSRREHRRVAFEAVRRRPGRADRAVTLVVERTGVGFYGQHAVDVAAAIGAVGRADLLPEVVGWSDGVLYQCLDGRPFATGRGPTRNAAALADYVAVRHRALRVGRDLSPRLHGRQAVWEVAAELVGSALGPFDKPLRVPVTNVLVRRVLEVAEPSVVDGRISPALWVGEPAAAVKLEFAEGAFSHRELWSYDPVFDLAAPAVAADGSDDLAAEVRRRYEDLTGAPIDPERWFLHRLVHVWDRRRQGESSPEEAAAATGAVVADLVAELLLDDLDTAHGGASTPGPQCVVDLDALERPVLGTTAPTRAGGLALRALVAHGHRVELVSRGGAAHLDRRCRSWRLDRGSAAEGIGPGEVASIIGHDAGACPSCAPLAGNDRRPCLLLLSAFDAGVNGAPGRIGEVLASARRASR